MNDFWRTSGYHLLRRNASGRLAVTEDFLRAYLMRPELMPVEGACDDEQALHEALLAQPDRPVSPDEIAALADEDARENYAVYLRFRDLLLAHDTIEGAYLSLFRDGVGGVPSLFVDQLVHVVVRNVLDGTTDALRVRAGELLFRPQKVTIQDRSIMVADDETVEVQAARERADGVVRFDYLGQLLAESSPRERTVELDILDPENADAYWARSERFDTVLDIGFARPGLDAFCRLLEAWLRHFFALEAAIQPVQAIRDDRWMWHVGLDSEATALLNALYNGVALSEEDNYRLLSLFRAEIKDVNVMQPRLRGAPVYMAMAMTEDGRLRIKPQNLLMNLPLVEVA